MQQPSPPLTRRVTMCVIWCATGLLKLLSQIDIFGTAARQEHEQQLIHDHNTVLPVGLYNRISKSGIDFRDAPPGIAVLASDNHIEFVAPNPLGNPLWVCLAQPMHI